ncbi:MAG TPA: cytochrome ubiquinol oxidase subunit I [Pyrinomonadaceae bacterium]|nr:cytochrome ubiquinol oxidase subunit I [Pyrinomonadaceae bacterium]
MDDFLAARSQMAMSLAFHIIFAAIGIAMPLLMIIAEWKWLRSNALPQKSFCIGYAAGCAARLASPFG